MKKTTSRGTSSTEATRRGVKLSRRQVLAGAGAAALTMTAAGSEALAQDEPPAARPMGTPAVPVGDRSPFEALERLPLADYPHRAHSFRFRPWAI